eukprot:1195748-Prorocentrum_minimum.AAC.9
MPSISCPKATIDTPIVSSSGCNSHTRKQISRLLRGAIEQSARGLIRHTKRKLPDICRMVSKNFGVKPNGEDALWSRHSTHPNRRKRCSTTGLPVGTALPIVVLSPKGVVTGTSVSSVNLGTLLAKVRVALLRTLGRRLVRPTFSGAERVTTQEDWRRGWEEAAVRSCPGPRRAPTRGDADVAAESSIPTPKKSISDDVRRFSWISALSVHTTAMANQFLRGTVTFNFNLPLKKVKIYICGVIESNSSSGGKLAIGDVTPRLVRYIGRHHQPIVSKMSLAVVPKNAAIMWGDFMAFLSGYDTGAWGEHRTMPRC